MLEGKFSEKDKDRVIDFLNFVSKKAKFEVDTNECIQYFSLLSYMQKELLPKINSNILEIKKVESKKSKTKE